MFKIYRLGTCQDDGHSETAGEASKVKPSGVYLSSILIRRILKKNRLN